MCKLIYVYMIVFYINQQDVETQFSFDNVYSPQ